MNDSKKQLLIENGNLKARVRARELLKGQDVSKEDFCKLTGYSEGQYYRWTGKANKSSQATTTQLAKVCMVFGWSPTYIIFGLGPRYLREIKDQEKVGEGLELAAENKILLTEVLEGQSKIIDILLPPDQKITFR
jgi:transcriptional regulator with XRE-family HTH domain